MKGRSTRLSEIPWAHAWLIYSHCNLTPLIYVPMALLHSLLTAVAT